MDKAGIILAAGRGERMKSATPKVLHKVANLPMLGHVVGALKGAGVGRILVVTAPGAETVRAYAESLGCETTIQDRQLGTGHAARAAAMALGDFAGDLVIVNGDMPLMTAENIQACLHAKARSGLALLVFEAADPASYGRVLLTPDGFLHRIVEYKDASESERRINLCNAGCYATDARKFFGWAARLANDNAQKEYYLTDVPALAKAEGVKCAIATVAEADMLGVNSRAELAEAEARMQARLRARALSAGVGMTSPGTVFFSHDTRLEADAEIEPFVVFGPGVAVAAGARIRAFSHLEGAEVSAGAIVGPYARLRPGARIGVSAHVGNFVEVKNSSLGKGAKANHLAYLGDADVGERANIGAGTVTCNYDGAAKHRTEIGANAFIGSNAALVAPVRIGEDAVVAAGSAITEDVEAGALAFGRARQVAKPGGAKRKDGKK